MIESGLDKLYKSKGIFSHIVDFVCCYFSTFVPKPVHYFTVCSKMHDNGTIPFFIETGK